MRLEGMFSRRSLAALAVLGACAAFAAALAVAVPRASAAEPYPVGARTLQTEHFLIHYSGDPLNTAYIQQQKAGDIGGWAERAYAAYRSWGYPAPVDDGDGLIDITVVDFPTTFAYPKSVADAAATPNSPAAGQSSGFIELNAATGLNQHQVAHVVFNVFEFAIWQPADLWLEQGAAEWAAYRLEDFATPTSDSIAEPDRSGDCVGGECGKNGYDRAGDPGWLFFEYLSERYGPGIVKQIFDDGASVGLPAPASTQYVSNVLATKGTTLSDAFTDYTSANVAGNYQIAALKGLPPATHATISTGAASGALPVQRVAVNHLAARYLKLIRGGSSTGPCYAATLSLTVALPAGLGARPFFYSSSVSTAAVPLTVSGGTASLTVPWDSCTGGADGYLSLPNPSLASNSQVFTVSGSLSVDTSTPATGTPPPAPLFTGPTVASPADYVPPAIYVYGAQVVRVSATDRLVRLIVFSSGPGRLRAAVGETALGTAELRAGNNDVRFRLPPAAVDSLRKALGVRVTSSVLTLTSLSAQGAPGTKVARKLVLVTPPKPRIAAARR